MAEAAPDRAWLRQLGQITVMSPPTAGRRSKLSAGRRAQRGRSSSASLGCRSPTATSRTASPGRQGGGRPRRQRHGRHCERRDRPPRPRSRPAAGRGRILPRSQHGDGEPARRGCRCIRRGDRRHRHRGGGARARRPRRHGSRVDRVEPPGSRRADGLRRVPPDGFRRQPLRRSRSLARGYRVAATAEGTTGLPAGIPILAMVGDSHAALYGHGVRAPGEVGATYGTCSSLMTLNPKRIRSAHGFKLRTEGARWLRRRGRQDQERRKRSRHL